MKVRPYKHTSSLSLVVPSLLIAVFGICLAGCSPRTPSASAKRSLAPLNNMQAAADNTKGMPDILRSVAAGIDPSELLIVVNPARAQQLHDLIAKTSDPDRRESLRVPYAEELMNSGQTEAALAELARSEAWFRRERPAFWEKKKNDLWFMQATCYLRLGEDQNCCSVNRSDSCILPIRGTGVHTRRAGSEHAMQVLEQILQSRPDSAKVRWLLNIAAMTLGKYPNGVPEQWRVDPAAFRSEYDIKRFPNVAPNVGLNLLGKSGGAIVDDLDGDGYLDIMVSGIGFDDQVRFFHNNGDATFTERTKEAHLIGETGGLNMIQADYDNDGHTDVIILRGGWMQKAARFPCSLLHNNGDGTFTDVTKKAGLMRAGPTQTAVWLDYNNDGWLDLFVGYESEPDNIQPCALYRNNHDGTFTDVAKDAGVDCRQFVKAAVSADYDNDGWPDLLLSCAGKKVVLHNNGNGTFTDVSDKAGITEPSFSFGAMFLDYDNDGWPDVFIIDYDIRDPANAMRDVQHIPVNGDHSHLYHNNRDGTFTDVSHAMHMDRVVLGMGNNFGDLDNDGYPDIYIGTGNPYLSTLIPNRMFRNAEGKYFQEVTMSGGFGHLQKGHGIAFADINNDGNQDVFAEMGGAFAGDRAYSALYANPGHGNHWITLQLQGVQTNRCAIGARIKATVRTAAGVRTVYKTVGSGGSFGCDPLRQEIGLGAARLLEKVEIYWPVSRKTQVVKGLAMDRFFHVREDQDLATPIKLKMTPWPASASGAKHLGADIMR